jgi:hypothetical protein
MDPSDQKWFICIWSSLNEHIRTFRSSAAITDHGERRPCGFQAEITIHISQNKR